MSCVAYFKMGSTIKSSFSSENELFIAEPFQNYFLNLPTTIAFICCINNFKTCVSKKKKRTSKHGYMKAYKPLLLKGIELGS